MLQMLSSFGKGTRKPIPGEPQPYTAKSKKGQTPLMLACEEGHAEVGRGRGGAGRGWAGGGAGVGHRVMVGAGWCGAGGKAGQEVRDWAGGWGWGCCWGIRTGAHRFRLSRE